MGQREGLSPGGLAVVPVLSSPPFASNQQSGEGECWEEKQGQKTEELFF